MSLGLRISTIVTTVLVAISVVGYLWAQSLTEARNQGGAMVIGIFWMFLTFLVTFPSCLITLGIWLGQRNRKSESDGSLKL